MKTTFEPAVSRTLGVSSLSISAPSTLILVFSLTISGPCGCSKDASSGRAMSHEGEREGFDFAYDYDPPSMSDVTGTPIGATPVGHGEIGAWARELPAFERTIYVRPPGASYGVSDGSSWTDALSGFPAELVRGTEYLFAAGDYYDGPWPDGRYFQHEFEEPESGGEYIGLSKATPDRHGTDDGWLEEFADGPSRFGPLALVTGYVVIDGQVGLGGSVDAYGFSISSRDCQNRADAPITFPWNSTATHVLLRHVNIQDCGHRPDPTNGSEDAIYAYDNSHSQFVLQNSYVHDAFRCLLFLQNCADILIEGTTFARAGLHHEANTLALRNCENAAIQRNVLVDAYGSMISLQGSRGVRVQGNVLRRTLDDWNLWAAVVLSESCSDISVHGNTFYGLAGLNVGVRAPEGIGSALEVFNNLWAHCRTNQIMLSGQHSHNAFYDNLRDDQSLDDSIEEETKDVLSAEPFVDAEAGDLRLVAPTAAGQVIEEPSAIDLLGVARGADGVWDRGAYEYAE